MLATLSLNSRRNFVAGCDSSGNPRESAATAKRLNTGAMRRVDVRCLVVPEMLASLAEGTEPDGDTQSPA